MIFEKDIFYIRVYKDRMEMKDVRRGAEITKNAVQPFSNNRMLIAEFDEAEKLLISMLAELRSNNVYTPRMVMVFQPVQEEDIWYSGVEKKSFKDLCEYLGAAETYLCFGKERLSDQIIFNGVNVKFMKETS